MKPITITQVEKLLNSYYDGKTTVAEEEQLREFFSAQHRNLPDSLAADAELFCQMEGLRHCLEQNDIKQAESQMPEGMEQRLRQTIDRLAASEMAAPSVEQDTPYETPTIARREKPHVTLWMGRVAACLTLILGLSLVYQLTATDPFADTCASPQEAQQQMERALALLNSKSRQCVDQAINNLEQPGQTAASLDNVNRFISFE